MPKQKEAPFAFDGLDRVLHEKARLSILTSLADHPKGLSFGELRDLCGLTDGNLSRHVQVLEESRLIEVTKGFEGRRPHTSCKLTTEGRQRFADYLQVLEQVLRSARRTHDRSQEPELRQNRHDLIPLHGYDAGWFRNP